MKASAALCMASHHGSGPSKHLPGCGGSAGVDPTASLPWAQLMLQPKDESVSQACLPAAACTEKATERRQIFLLREVENSLKRKEVMENGPKVHLGASQTQFS